MGIEPMTSSLPRMRSTTELRRLAELWSAWSGRRDSNPQHLAWKASALPLRYARPYSGFNDQLELTYSTQNRNGAGGRIRTFVEPKPAGFTARCH
jgi:hypothetical protein